MVYDLMYVFFMILAIIPWAVLFHRESVAFKWVCVLVQLGSLSIAMILHRLG